jgi:hypothetical protein
MQGTRGKLGVGASLAIWMMNKMSCMFSHSLCTGVGLVSMMKGEILRGVCIK